MVLPCFCHGFAMFSPGEWRYVHNQGSLHRAVGHLLVDTPKPDLLILRVSDFLEPGRGGNSTWRSSHFAIFPAFFNAEIFRWTWKMHENAWTCMKMHENAWKWPNVEILVPGYSRILLVEMPIHDFPGFGWSEPDRARASLITIVLRDPSWRSTIHQNVWDQETNDWNSTWRVAPINPGSLCSPPALLIGDYGHLMRHGQTSRPPTDVGHFFETWWTQRSLGDTPKWSAFKVESPRVKRYL